MLWLEMPEMMYEGHLRWEGTMGCRKQAMANRYAPALGFTYTVYIDSGTYNSPEGVIVLGLPGSVDLKTHEGIFWMKEKGYRIEWGCHPYGYCWINIFISQLLKMNANFTGAFWSKLCPISLSLFDFYFQKAYRLLDLQWLVAIVQTKTKKKKNQ